MKIHRTSNACRGGFSLVELVIAMTILTVLAGVVSMRAGGMTNRARAAKITTLIESLRTPVMTYHLDTNQLPLEYSGYTGATYHRLSADPGIAGWDGPYIETPINRSWHPAGATVHMYAAAQHAVSNDYDVDGDGTADVTQANACSMSFWQIDEDLAQLVNDAVDEGLPGDWMDTGRVEYTPASSVMSVMIYSR